jgi:hypothetical protein
MAAEKLRLVRRGVRTLDLLHRKHVLNRGAARRLIVAGLLVENTTFEKHYRISDLARLWGLGRETVHKLVKEDPGVIKIRMGRKKAHTIYSVPESAAQRIHTRLLNAAQVRQTESLPALAFGLSSNASLRIFVRRTCLSGTHRE